MGIEAFFGKQTPWGQKVASADDLARLFANGHDGICVSLDVRNEWLLKHRHANVNGRNIPVEFDDGIGGGLWVARLWKPKADAAGKPAEAPATPTAAQ